VINGYSPPATSSNPTVAQFQALDEIFAGYPRLTLVHIIPALFFLLLAPLQLSRTFRDRHLQWHRRTRRIQLLCGVVVGASALMMSFGMPAIGGEKSRCIANG